jgi:N-acetylneuraminic acid mutarotase
LRAALFLAAILSAVVARSAEWKTLPPLPDKEGFAGSFAGVARGVLLVAGGANFPDKKPWEGGKKVWHAAAFVLETPGGQWKPAGKLPRPLAYGVSASQGDGLVCVGGSDSARHYADVFRLDWNDGRLVTTPLPPLPRTMANGCGALVGEVLYVAGGQETPTSETTLKAAWRIDLSAGEPLWEEIEPWPGSGRMLSAAAGFDGSFWLLGGVDLITGEGAAFQRRYLVDAYRYTPGTGWKRITDLPHPVTAAPSPAAADESGFLINGGDDGTQVGTAPDRHRGFSRKILRYDPKTATWIDAGNLPAPRVTVPLVRWRGAWVIPGGEMRPGVRSPEVWAFPFGVPE